MEECEGRLEKGAEYVDYLQAQQEEMAAEIAMLKKSQRLEQPEREALAWIQTGRLELNLHNWTNAHQAFDTAKRYVKAHHHREWGAILAGYSRICQNTNKLDHAYQYALQSLEHYANAKWMWAVQAMLSNLGAVCIEKSNRFTSKNPSKEHVWLTRAAQHLEHCTTLCDTSGIGTESAACEINLGHVNRRLGQTDLARGWLDRAYHLAVRAGNQFDLAMTHAETAELELQTGNKNTAITSLETALELYQCINHEAQTRVTRNRLEEVQR